MTTLLNQIVDIHRQLKSYQRVDDRTEAYSVIGNAWNLQKSEWYPGSIPL